jgi:hypothetical protein
MLQHVDWEKVTGPARAGSGTGENPSFGPPPARADRLKIFTLNEKDRPSVQE